MREMREFELSSSCFESCICGRGRGGNDTPGRQDDIDGRRVDVKHFCRLSCVSSQGGGAWPEKLCLASLGGNPPPGTRR